MTKELVVNVKTLILQPVNYQDKLLPVLLDSTH